MTVNIQEDNIYKYAHVHCYVADSESEGYAISELKRYLEVEDIMTDYVSKEEGKCIAELNVDEPTEEELAQIRWDIEEKNRSEYNGKETITHNLKEENVHEINFKAYIDGKVEDAALAYLTYDENPINEVKEEDETNN